MCVSWGTLYDRLVEGLNGFGYAGLKLTSVGILVVDKLSIIQSGSPTTIESVNRLTFHLKLYIT